MTEEKMIANAVGLWNVTHGKGSFVIPAPINPFKVFLYLLPNLYNKSPTSKTVIVVNDFADKDKITEFLTHGDNPVWNNSFSKLITLNNISIVTDSYISDNINLFSPDLVIIYNPKSFLFSHLGILEKSTFKLVIFTKLIDNNAMNNFYSVAPLIDGFKQADINEVIASPPVEESVIPLIIDPESKEGKLLEYYNKEISTAIAIFGTFDNIKTARVGNSITNTSSMAICENIARQNGWSRSLDMSSQFNVEIDKLYNPNAIRDRAGDVYDKIRERSKLLASSEQKVKAILDIIDAHRDKKILLINKFGEFASYVTGVINDNYANVICMNYHDKVDNVPAVDDDGNPIVYKSGAHKGEQKFLGATSQKKLAQKKFNAGKINILSTTNAPDKELNINVDIVIITSPLCETIESYVYRLSKTTFKTPIELYTLYYKNTLEERLLNDRKLTKNHKIVNKAEITINNGVNSDYIVVD